MKVKAIASQQKVRASSAEAIKSEPRDWTDKQARVLMQRLLKRNKKTLDALARL